MVDATLRIKNLSIALEALSRINHPIIGGTFNRIEVLLDKEITEMQKETQWPLPQRPVRNATDTDDIPF